MDRLFREQAGRLTSTLTRVFGPQHLDLAEDVVQEAMVKALRRWPYEGVPDHPAAWLLRVARNEALDRLRRDTRLHERAPLAARELHALPEPPSGGGMSELDPLADDQLRMILLCAHPCLGRDAQVTLTLRTVGGLGVQEIARAFLTTPTAIAQRIVRAKRRLRDEGLAFEMPPPGELPARLDAVLEVLYLIFNEGHLAHSGEALVRTDLCVDALRLARLLARHPATDRPAVHALCALFCFVAARLPARVDGDGALVPLAEQDRSRWLAPLVAGGLRHLERSATGPMASVYHLQAEIEGTHVTAASWEATDWKRIVAAYDRLVALAPSPVASLNRAVAIGTAAGAHEGLAALEAIPDPASLAGYYPYHASRAELLHRAGRSGEAAAALRSALDLAPPSPVQAFLRRKLDRIEGQEAPGTVVTTS